LPIGGEHRGIRGLLRWKGKVPIDWLAKIRANLATGGGRRREICNFVDSTERRLLVAEELADLLVGGQTRRRFDNVERKQRDGFDIGCDNF